MRLALGLGLPAGGGAPAFSPLSLSPFAWYDPSDLSTLFQNSNGTTAVAADGDPVGYMADKSGNGNHLIQATAGSRPLYKTSGGPHWLEFDGTADVIADTFTLAQPLDRVMAFRQLTWNSSETLWDGGSANACRIYQSSAEAEPNMRAFAGSAEIDLSDEPAVGVDGVITERWSGASSRWAIDNNNYATGNPGTAAADGLTIGAFGNSTEGFSSLRFYGGVIKSAFTDPEIALLRTYLASKQGRVL